MTEYCVIDRWCHRGVVYKMVVEGFNSNLFSGGRLLDLFQAAQFKLMQWFVSRHGEYVSAIKTALATFGAGSPANLHL